MNNPQWLSSRLMSLWCSVTVKPGGCFFKNSFSRRSSRTSAFSFAVLKSTHYFRLDLLGGVLLLVPCDPVTTSLRHKIVRGGHRGDRTVLHRGPHVRPVLAASLRVSLLGWSPSYRLRGRKIASPRNTARPRTWASWTSWHVLSQGGVRRSSDRC